MNMSIAQRAAESHGVRLQKRVDNLEWQWVHPQKIGKSFVNEQAAWEDACKVFDLLEDM